MSFLQSNQAQPPSIRSRFLSIPTLVSFCVAAALIFFLAVRFDLDWSATWDNVRGMNPWLYLLAFGCYYLSFPFRGLRWRMLARNAQAGPSPPARLPSVPRCSQLVLIGWFVNSITWFRLGDAYRAYAFSEDSKGSFSWGLGTVLAERVLDMATVFAVILVSAAFLTTTRESSASGYILAAASIMAFALLGLVLLMRTYGAWIARLLPHRLEAAYRRFQQGALGSFRNLPLVLALGLVAWFFEMARVYFVVQALDVSIGLALVPVVAMGHAILSTVPTPGGVGAVEPGITGLLLLDLARNDAVSVAAVDRSITYISVLLIGGLMFLLMQVVRARRRRRCAIVSDRVGKRAVVADD